MDMNDKKACGEKSQDASLLMFEEEDGAVAGTRAR